MTDRQELKARALRTLETHADEIIGIARDIFREPELGFKETRTARKVGEWFGRMGMSFESELALTGLKAVVDTGRPGPTVAILGELDSLLNWEHPEHDPVTGAVHACGHNCQIAIMLGTAMALRGVLPDLSGRLAFMAVPAEEYIELEERLEMRNQGKLKALSGKGEMVRIGAFDDVDMAMMVHASTRTDMGSLMAGGTANGMVAKFVRFIGHTSHAGGQPDKGINALYAAHVALAGINALRETFRDQDHVRVHPIITRGGDVVNAIPGDVRMELFCRAATLDAIEQTHLKVDRALKAGALALGGSVEITTLPGYLPLSNDGTMVNLFIENARSIVGADQVRRSDYHGGGSTDMGDLAHIMPVLHPSAAGARGSAHGADFFIDDYTKSVIDPAKALAMTAIDLLADDARQAKQIKADFRPKMSRSEYVAYLDRMTYTQTWKASDLDG